MENNRSREEFIRKFIRLRKERLRELGNEFSKISPYKEWIDEERILLAKLKHTMPEKQQNILEKYVDVNSSLMLAQTDFYYDSGYGDCVAVVVRIRERWPIIVGESPKE